MIRPLVSVIVATYRRTESLKAAIASVITQTYPNIEIVVVDDNASLEWNQKVETMVREFENINYIQNKENQGSAETRNIGVRASKGQYITFLDDDDEYMPDKISRQLMCMIEKTADYSITDLQLINESEQIIECRKRDYLIGAKQEDYLSLHLMHHMSGTDTLMFKRIYLLRIGGFPPINLGDEFYLMLNAILEGGKLCYLPECSVKAYVHEGESGLSSGQSKLKCENDLFQEKQKYFDQLDRKTIYTIKMRHYAVLAFAEMRIGNRSKFIVNGVKSFLASPVACLKLLKGRK